MIPKRPFARLGTSPLFGVPLHAASHLSDPLAFPICLVELQARPDPPAVVGRGRRAVARATQPPGAARARAPKPRTAPGARTPPARPVHTHKRAHVAVTHAETSAKGRHMRRAPPRGDAAANQPGRWGMSHWPPSWAHVAASNRGRCIAAPVWPATTPHPTPATPPPSPLALTDMHAVLIGTRSLIGGRPSFGRTRPHRARLQMMTDGAGTISCCKAWPDPGRVF